MQFYFTYFSYIVSDAAPSNISMSQFSDFLRAVGPLNTSIATVTQYFLCFFHRILIARRVHQMKKLAKEDWWCGWLSGEESTEVLMGQPRGTYLVSESLIFASDANLMYWFA